MIKKIILMLIIGSSTLLSGCRFNDKIENGDKVELSFTGTFADQSIFESKNISITEGSGEIIKGIEEAILNMQKGESKTVTITPEKGYGNQYKVNKVQKIPSIIFEKAQVATNIHEETEIAGLKGIIKSKEQDENGNTIIVFDLNEPETYKNLTYTITIKNINK